jgi:hypothetical protein
MLDRAGMTGQRQGQGFLWALGYSCLLRWERSDPAQETPAAHRRAEALYFVSAVQGMPAGKLWGEGAPEGG